MSERRAEGGAKRCIPQDLHCTDERWRSARALPACDITQALSGSRDPGLESAARAATGGSPPRHAIAVDIGASMSHACCLGGAPTRRAAAGNTVACCTSLRPLQQVAVVVVERVLTAAGLPWPAAVSDCGPATATLRVEGCSRASPGAKPASLDGRVRARFQG